MQGISHPEHPAHRPGAAPGGGGGRPRQRHRHGRRDRPGPWSGADAPPVRPRSAHTRLHPDDRPLPGRGQAVRRLRDGAGGAGPGAERGAGRLPLPARPHPDRGLRTWGPVHVLVGAVLLLLSDRRAQRQPGDVRPALPHELRLEREGGRISPVPEGSVHGGPPEGAPEHGGGLFEAGGADEAARVCGHRHRDLCQSPSRGPGAHGGGGGDPEAGFLPPGLHRRISYRPEGAGHVRHPPGGEGAQGALCPGPGLL